ncbi:secreted immunoglobulin domain 1 [Cheilinus undulatus]|uniref:secreted immunoglobulin domain 1 n=1 Tax=Cheilinus undulatus TaxID=241271 RepID=UPI001BD3FB01|nr:secreted immunoglobulin domain 1 [Cheilinus undulatus]
MESGVICAIFVCGVCLSQHVPALPASTLHVRVGENITLHCPLLNTTNTTATTAAPPDLSLHGLAPSTISWYRKPEGQGPQLLLSFRSTNRSEVTYGTGICSDKISAAANGSLRLHGSQSNDTGVYFCGVSQGLGRKEGRTKN